MAQEVTLEELRVRLEQAGLSLGEYELQQLVAGVNRSQLQAAALRELLTDEVEPANQFSLVAKK